jgi:rhamnosyltransferase
MYRIAAYITAYEDIEAVEKCITAIKEQTYPVEIIYIIDNSSNLLISTLLKETDVIIQHYPENIGISGGLVLSIQWAIEQNYDFLWTFDQDSQPLTDCLKKLVDFYEILTKSGKKIGVIAPLPTDVITGQILHGIVFDKYRFIDAPDCKKDKDYYQCDAVITSGSLVCLNSAKNVPLPNKDLFIDAVDWEYCMNFKKAGYDIYVIKSAILKHRFGNSRSAKALIRERNVTIYNYPPLRYYYMSRNHTFIEMELAKKENALLQSIAARIKFVLITIAKFIFYERQFLGLKCWACLKGTYDGFTGKLGKTWLP